eukprot:3717040-Prymnesium_polylepis.1
MTPVAVSHPPLPRARRGSCTSSSSPCVAIAVALLPSASLVSHALEDCDDGSCMNHMSLNGIGTGWWRCAIGGLQRTPFHHTSYCPTLPRGWHHPDPPAEKPTGMT